MIRKFVGVALLVVATATAYGADSREGYRSDFEKPGWEPAWSFKGSAGPADQDALVSGGRELTAAQASSAPAARVEHDVTLTATGQGDEISDHTEMSTIQEVRCLIR